MNITVRLLTVPVLSIDVFWVADDPVLTTPLDKGVKGMSRWWTRRMSK